MTGYLTAEGVDSTLAFIANHSGPGSAVIFDYFTNETLRGPEKRKIWRLMRVIGEEIIFGIDEGQIEPFLIRRDFFDVRNVNAEDLKRLYLPA